MTNAGGIAVPPMAWTKVTSTGEIIGYVSGNVDGCVYVQARHGLACEEQYRSGSSEPNQNWFVYSLDTNINSLASATSRFQSPYWAEPGHTSGDLAIDPTTSVAYSFGMNSGGQVNGEGATKTTTSFDFFASVGKNVRAPVEPQYNTSQQTCAWDVYNRKLVCWGGDSSNNSLQLYDPATAAWTINPALTGTCPASGLLTASIAFNTNNGLVYLTGGAKSGTLNTGLYTINISNMSCALLSPTGGPPPARHDASLVYDQHHNKLVLFGGATSAANNTCSGGTTCLLDTWVYDVAANAWTEIDGTVGTPTATTSVGTVEYRFGYDPEYDVIVCLPQGQPGNAPPFYYMLRLSPGPNIGVNSSLTNSATPGGLNHDAGSWTQLGHSVLANSSKAYVGFSQYGLTNFGTAAMPHAFVQDITTGTAVNVPNPATALSITADTGNIETFDTTMAFDGSNNPWMCWNELQGSSITIRMNCKGYAAGSWSLGGVVTAIQPSGFHIIGPPKLVNAGGLLTMIYLDNDRSINTVPNTNTVYVAQYSGSAWTILGGAALNVATTGTNPVVTFSASIATDGTNPYAAWTEYTGLNVGSPPSLSYGNTKAYLKYWNGSTWALQCGGSANVTSTDWVENISAAYYGGFPVVAFTERSSSGLSRLYVRSCQSGSWVTLGSGDLRKDTNSGWVFSPRLSVGGGSLYLTWDEQGNEATFETGLTIAPYLATAAEPVRVYVKQWNGTTWSSLGGALNADTAQGTATNPAIAYSTVPVVAIGEHNFGANRAVYAKQWNGTDWVPVGAAGAPLTITTASLPATTVGAVYSQPLAASGGTAPYTWTTTAITGAFCTGMTLSSAGVISINPVSGSSCTFTVQVTDAVPTTVQSVSLIITVNAVPVISTASPLTAATYGVLSTQTLAATGGTLPLAWSVVSGAPSGMSLNPAGVFSGTPSKGGQGFNVAVLVTDAAGVTATKTFKLNVNPVFSFGNASIVPTNCSHTTASYAPLDLNVCTTPGEVPLGTFAVPAVGAAYNDGNFGTPITLLSRNDIQGASQVGYAGPTPFSATGAFAAIAVNTNTKIIGTTTGAVQASPVNGSVISSSSLEWDASDDHVYYYCSGTQFRKYNWFTNNLTVLIDFATAIDVRTGLAFGWTSCSNGGTGDISKDNWWGGFSDDAHHTAVLVNLNNLHVHARDWEETHNGVTPGGLDPNICTPTCGSNGYVLVSKGVDSVSGKRYAVVTSAPLVFMSVTNDINNGVMDFEGILEEPANIDPTGPPHLGNDNNICEAGERCFNTQHNATMEDTDGQQYLVSPNDQNPVPSGPGYFRTVSYYRLNAGTLMVRSAASEGGGRTDMPILLKDVLLDGHVQCANKAPYCIWSTAPGSRTAFDTTSAYTHSEHFGTATVIRGVALEFRQLVYGRTIMWNGGYWEHLFASLSADGTKAIWSTNFGLLTTDTHNNVVTAPTGFASTSPLTITTTSISQVGDVGFPYGAGAVRILAGGGTQPYTFSIQSGTFPPGLLLTASGVNAGLITSTPTSAVGSPFNFVVLVQDAAGGSATQPLAITINPALAIPTTSPLAPAVVGVAYSQPITATGGTLPRVCDISTGTLAGSGLTLNSACVVSGTPIAPSATYNFTARVTDALGAAFTKPFALSVGTPATITSTSPLPPGSLSVAYSYTFTATGDLPITWSATGLPSWASFNTSSGTLSGTPDAAATSTINVSASNSVGSDGPKAFSLPVGALGNANAIVQGTAVCTGACKFQ